MVNLKAARIQSGLTQKEAAEKTGIALGTLRRWEQGVNDPDTQTLIQLARFYGVSMDYLLGTKFAEGNNVATEKSDMRTELLDNREVALVNMYRTLNDKNKDLVIKITTLFCE